VANEATHAEWHDNKPLLPNNSAWSMAGVPNLPLSARQLYAAR